MTSYTTWLCVSCYSCIVECPKGIKITDVMYALKQMAIREGMYPKRLPIPVLARGFFKIVRKHGRNNEGLVTMRMHFKTNPIIPLRNLVIGIRMYMKGRIGFYQDRIKGKAQLQKILDNVH